MPIRICVTGDSNAYGSSADPVVAGRGWRHGLLVALGVTGYDAILVGRTVDSHGAHEANPGRTLQEQRELLPEILAANSPDILIVQIGTVTLGRPTEPRHGLIRDDYRGMLDVIKSLSPLLHIICVALPPVIPEWGGITYAASPHIPPFNEALPTIVKDRAILVAPAVDPELHMDSDGPAPAPGEPSPGSHLNWPGYQLFASAIYGAVSAILDTGVAHLGSIEVTIAGKCWRSENVVLRPAVE